MQLLRSSFEHCDEQNMPRSGESQECGMLENSSEQEAAAKSGSCAASAEGLQSRLTAVLDCLSKVSEASLKRYELTAVSRSGMVCISEV